MLEFEQFERVGDGRGEGVYERRDGTRWYMKYPESERQAHNEVLASRLYDAMGFDAINYRLVDNGMVAGEYREGLPDRSDPAALRENDTVQEVFLPSALLANWDVIGLTYDNCLYDPGEMPEPAFIDYEYAPPHRSVAGREVPEPVFLDFGGAFDTRAMGGHKQYSATSVPSLEGFTDPAVNESAARVFGGMTASLYRASQARIAALTVGEMRDAVRAVPLDGADERLRVLRARADILLDTEYGEVFDS